MTKNDDTGIRKMSSGANGKQDRQNADMERPNVALKKLDNAVAQ